MAKGIRSKSTKFFGWLLMGLLMAGLTGFGIRSVSGNRALVVGSVGNEEIGVNAYAQALSNEIRAASQRFGTNLTLDQARSIGIDRQVLTQLLATAALDNEAAIRGLSVGDSRVRDQLLGTDAFLGPSGNFDQTAYEYALRQASLTPSEYDTIVRKQETRGLLQTAITTGISPDATYAETLYSYLAEGRSIRWTKVSGNSGATGAPDPTDAQISTYYTDNPEQFTSALTRKITYVSLTARQVAATLVISESDVQDAYDAQSARFNIPAKRIVDRLVFSDQAEAEAAMSDLQSGAKIFADVVADRGLNIDDVDLGQVTHEDLAETVRDAVFFLTDPGLVGPLDSEFGPAIYRVNAILAAQITPFEQARAPLSFELAFEQAKRQIDDLISVIDDILAGGATLEDVAAETDMTLATLDFNENSTDGLAANENFRTDANAITVEDFPEIKQLPDGGIYALRLDSIAQPALIPLEDVRAQVIESWKIAANRAALIKKAENLKLLLDSGGDFKNLELSTRLEENIRRDAFPDGAPVDMVSTLFGLKVGDVALVAGPTSVVLARLIDIVPFSLEDAGNKDLITTLQGRFGDQLASDIFEVYASALQESAGVTVNQSVLSAVNRQLNGTGQLPSHNRAP